MQIGQRRTFETDEERKSNFIRTRQTVFCGVELGNIFSQMTGVARFLAILMLMKKTLDVVHKHFSDAKLSIRILTSQMPTRKDLSVI